MRVTITTGGEQFAPLEVVEDMEVENFIALAQMEFPHYQAVSAQSFMIVVNGRKFLTSDSNVLKRSIADLGITNDEVVYVLPASAGAHPARQATSPPSLRTPTSNITASPADVSALISGLVSSIKVPPKGQAVAGSSRATSSPRTLMNQQYRIDSKNLYDLMKKYPDRKERLRDAEHTKGLLETFEKNPEDYEAFHKAYVGIKEEEERKWRLAQDPTSVEGQKYLEEMINKQQIQWQEQMAHEHMPEAFIPVHMLYIRMKINGHSVLAFVDSGAQVSIMSETCARRVNIMRLLDTRYSGVAQGVGGQGKINGRIHSVDVQVENHKFPMPFNVMGDRNMDILLGLNILRRHQCCIDLAKNVLLFGDGTETPFIGEEEYRREKEVLDKAHAESDAMDTDVQVDTEKLAHLIELGFDADAAREELVRNNNDLEIATNNLFLKKSEQ